MRLMTNNPAKYRGLAGYGLEIVERVPLVSRPRDENVRYLLAKQQKLGHLLELDARGMPSPGPCAGHEASGVPAIGG
jgi:3,4-dihydroxy 2-butanone 4-phosphate synthase/GTP cyclohydrolase II